MQRLKKWSFWFCLLLSVLPLMVAQSEFVGRDRGDPLPEFVSAEALIVPAVLFWLAAAWALSRRGIVVALAASLMTCGLIFIGMFYEVGLETGMIIYAVAASIFGANLLTTRHRAPVQKQP